MAAPLSVERMPVVNAIHDAACQGDYDAVLPHMSDPFGSLQLRKDWAIGLWPADAPDGDDPLALLAETLETPVHSGQGGAHFCHPDGPVVVFARPLADQPQLMTDFDLTGQTWRDQCQRAS